MPATPGSRKPIADTLLRAKQAAAAQFLISGARAVSAAYAVSVKPLENVVGVGIGRKIIKGRATSQPCVRIYVERKVAKGLIPGEFLLPPRVEGVSTDIVEAGRFRALPALVLTPRRRLRPARPGCSVGFQFTGPKAGFVMAGTLGAVVQAAGTRYILSNNHVLAEENGLPIGSPIFQPGLLDHGNPERDQIARLTGFIPLVAGGQNTVDCAIAEVLEAQSVRATFLPRVGRLKSPDPIEAAEGMRVHKTGRTTGYTTGTVFDVSADISVGYDLGTLIFQDQILIRGEVGKGFSDSGDSGSVIVDRDSRRPTALLFAGSQFYTVANHLGAVLAQLGVTVVR